MRRIGLIGLMLMAAVIVFGAPPIQMQVTTNAIKILQERGLRREYGILWSKTNLVSQGAVIRYGNNQYMAEADGRLGTNAPVFTSGTASNGTAILRYIEKGQRTGFVVMLNSTNGTVRINVTSPAVPGVGIQLKGERSIWQDSGYGVPQGAIYVVSDDGTNGVAAMEW